MKNNPEDSPQILPDQDSALEVLKDQPAGSLLKLRDVQALNRSFRRLSDVQESLLRQMEESEKERRRQNRWLIPVAGFCGLAASVACGILGWAVWNDKPDPEIQVQAPEVTIQPPAITVQAPDNAVDQDTVEALLQEIRAMREDSELNRATIAQLNEELLERERRELERLSAVGRPSGTPDFPAPPGLTGPEDQGVSAPTEAGSPAASEAEITPAPLHRSDPWLGATNGLFAVAGYDHLRFERGTRVEGQASLTDVSMTEWNAEGVMDTLIQAEVAEFQLHQMTGDLILVLKHGSRSKGGAKAPLPEEGLRLEFERMDSNLWLQHFPELASHVEVDPAHTKSVREALDALLEIPGPAGYYRIPVLEEALDSEMRYVQVSRYATGGRLLRTLEADALEIRLHPGGDVELLFRNGAILEGGLRRPFYEDRFRIYLPRQDLNAWRESGIPYIDLG